MKRISVLLLFVLATVNIQAEKAATLRVWTEEPTSFFGIKFHAPLNSSISECPKQVLYGVTYYHWYETKSVCYEPVANFFEVYNAVGFFHVYVKSISGNVEGITASFRSERAQEVGDSLEQKFGPALERHTIPVRTRGGVEYSNSVMEWPGKDISISFESLGSTVDEGLLVVSTVAYLKMQAAKDQQSAEQLKNSY